MNKRKCDIRDRNRCEVKKGPKPKNAGGLEKLAKVGSERENVFFIFLFFFSFLLQDLGMD